MRVDLHLDKTRNVLFEKYSNYSNVYNLVLSCFNDCEIKIQHNMSELLFFTKQNDILFVEDFNTNYLRVFPGHFGEEYYNKNFRNTIKKVLESILKNSNTEITFFPNSQSHHIYLKNNSNYPEVLLFHPSNLRINKYISDVSHYYAKHYSTRILKPEFVNTRNKSYI